MLINTLLAGCISIYSVGMPEDIYDDAALENSVFAM